MSSYPPRAYQDRRNIDQSGNLLPPGAHPHPGTGVPSSGAPQDNLPLYQEQPSRGRPTNVFVNIRETSRTPSPTPSEAAYLEQTGFFDFKAMKSRKFWLRKQMIPYYIFGTIILLSLVLIAALHTQIVNALQGPANSIRKLPAGWIIPIAFFFVLSFPPLFGHEVLAILVGVVWGLWPGFGITAAGTLVGEIGNFFAFKYCCSSRAQKWERTKLFYACFAKVVREGGFKVAIIARYSAVPAHFTTAVFSTCGMGFWTFLVAAVLSLPKQFISVYLGVALEESNNGSSNKKQNIVKAIVVIVMVAVTLFAMRYIRGKINAVKTEVVYERRKRRQEKQLRVDDMSGMDDSNSFVKDTSSDAFHLRAPSREVLLSNTTSVPPV